MAASARLDALAIELEALASVENTESFADALPDYVQAAIVQHDKGLTIDSLPEAEEECVLTLAWIKVCLVRASKAAQDANITGAAGFGADRNSPYNKNMSLAKDLMARYSTLCSSIQPSKSRVVTGQLYVRDQVFDALVPLMMNQSPTKILLSGSVAADNTAILSWTVDQMTDFHEFLLFFMEGTDAIYQQWNNFSALGVARINDGATKVFSYNSPQISSVKATEVDHTKTNRFLLVMRTRSGSYVYSNELVCAPS